MKGYQQAIWTACIILLGIALNGCVLQKKYDDLLNEKNSVETDKTGLEEQLSIQQDKNQRLEKELKSLKGDTASIGKAFRKSSDELRKLKAEHETLQEYYDNLQANKGQLDQDLLDKQNELMTLQTDLSLEQERNETLFQDLQEREEKVAELERILEEKDKVVNELKNTVSRALLNFKENDLTVEVKNGKVYVSLAEQLLFRSGSVVVDDKGKQALSQLASVLKNEKDINIMVEGHTDNVPIGKTGQYMKDNWDLSVLRSTSIIRILTSQGVPPQRITSSGKGEYSPVGDNSSAESRKKNRRTEIILTPKLDELFKLLE